MTGASGAEMKGVCTEAGMYALRERRLHVTQEDFELAAAKACNPYQVIINLELIHVTTGDAEGQREKHVDPQVLHIEAPSMACMTATWTIKTKGGNTI